MGRPSALTSRQVNLALEVLVLAALLTGVSSWAVGDRWGGWFVVGHGVAGVALVLLAPAKLRGSVRTGFRRGRSTRWISAAFGVMVLVTVALGVLHATGLWSGVGPWSALWTHSLVGFALVPLFVWHLVTRPVRHRATDLDRRAVVRSGLLLGAAAGVYVAQETTTSLTGLAGGSRRGTGSHEVASGDPTQMPTVSWFDDRRPDVTDADAWQLTIAGRVVAINELRARTRPVPAVLDCTGGWWSEQSWDAVALADLLVDPSGHSVRVRSATGYDRLFGLDALDGIYLAVGYGGEPLRPGHGAPVRLVVPGRRGPWWVKWVTSVEPDDRPSWMQPPLPLA